MPQLTEVLPAIEIEKYKAQGFTEHEIAQAITELQQEETQAQQQSALQQSYARAVQQQQNDVRNYASQTLVSGSVQDNLIKWQLELDSILERVEHMLRGDKPKFINGNMMFMPPETNEEKIFTDFGVAEIMRILSMYLNRNTILSNYDDETIRYKVFDFGNEIADLIYLKYESMFATLGFNEAFAKIYGTEYGNPKFRKTEKNEYIVEVVRGDGQYQWQKLNNEMTLNVLKEIDGQALEKRKLYSIIVREIVDIVHSAYLRAYHGGERMSLHEQRSVSQSETIIPQGIGFAVGGQPVMQQRSMLNPARWFSGKYK